MDIMGIPIIIYKESGIEIIEILNMHIPIPISEPKLATYLSLLFSISSL